MAADPNIPLAAALIDQQRWAMQTLLSFCAAQPDAVLERSAPGSFGTMRATLLHIVQADVDYVERAGGQRPPGDWDGNWPGFARLQELHDWAAAALLTLATAQPELQHVTERSGRLWCSYPLVGLIIQANQHGTEHRAQICSILSSCGIEPPELSGWEWMISAGLWAEGEDAA